MREEEGFSGDRIRKREAEISKVAENYGFDGIHKLGIPATYVDRYPMQGLIQKACLTINNVQPNIIYLPFMSDVHSDHRIVFDAFYSSVKTFRCPFIKKIMMMETLSETEFAPSTKGNSFVPNVFVDVSDYLERKIEIMEIYQGECGPHPFPRSARNVRALASLRGATAGCEYAESFMLLKEII
jgi:LmbE family N-acetylglucosaminyl deacetylase